MNRFYQALLLATFLPLCWLAMMVIHELGHVLGALATDGTVSNVVLHPFAISRTDLSDNPSPLLVVWSGPVFGVLLPLAFLAVFRFGTLPWRYLIQFFTGFCLVANGAYIGMGSFDRVGDCGEMLRHGSPIWSLWLFGGVVLPLGFLLWHGLGPDFGFGKNSRNVDRRAAFSSFGLLLLILILEVTLSGR